MPTYPVINLETKEKKTLSMTMKAYSEWKEENPGWDKDWSEGCAGQSTDLSGLVKQNLMDGMRSWIVHLNNQVPMSAKTDTTVNPSNLL